MKKLYLDIDGVLLTSKHVRAADNVTEFIVFITSHFDCYWLTTHCKGNVLTAMNYLSNYFTDKNILNLLQTIKPTNWQTLKTEAIDFESDFYWIEDFPFQAEMKILEQYNKLENLICVDLKNPNELLNVVEALNSK